jgi:hypothetical protein
MSNKIFGITVKDNIPYIRTIIILEKDISEALSNNDTITGITNIITIDDDCVEENCFNEKLKIQNNEFNSENYNGEFHLFINQEYTNGYYTTGTISYNDKMIISTLPFINKFNIQDVITEINISKQIIDNTELLTEIIKEEEIVEDKIDEINKKPQEEETILSQLSELNQNISNIDNSIKQYKEILEEIPKLEVEKEIINIDVKKRQENIKQLINEMLNKRQLEEMYKEVQILLENASGEQVNELLNIKQEIDNMIQIMDNTNEIIYIRIKDIDDDSEKQRIITEEKIKFDKETQELKEKIENWKKQQKQQKQKENNDLKVIQTQQEQQTIDIEPTEQPSNQIAIETLRVTPANNNISIITNTQGKLSNELIQKIQTINAQFENLKNQLQGNKINGGSQEQQNEEMNKCIELYIDIVQNIIYRPIFYKLTSLNCQDFKNILINDKSNVLYDGTITGNNKNKVSSEYSKNMYNTLLSFMYVNMSSFDGSELTDKFFYENNKGLTYKNALNKYKLYNENYTILLEDNENKENKEEPKLIIYVAEFVNLLSSLLKNDNINNSNKMINYKYNLYETLLNYITSQYNILNTIVTKYFPLLELSDNEEFRNKIDKYIEIINNNNIITYLKLRNDEDGNKQYNDRFKILINKSSIENPNKLMVDYMDDNLPYYIFDKNEDKYILSDEIKQTGGSDNNYKLNEIINKVNIQTYKYHYLFGPFAHIFTPDVKNEQIAENMIVIKDKIKENKPIFMIGYGASGAGKTSSLIYFKKNSENGILINLCNQLGSEGIFDDIELKCKEFYHTTGVGSVQDPEIVNAPNEQIGSIKFTFDRSTNNFILNERYTHITHHQYRLITPTREHFEKETVFEKGSKLGEVIIHLIDTDRFVKATTNNPNSSRSHTLVFVKLLGKEIIGSEEKEKIGNIIIGDFAGVENKFSCENPNTIKAFLSVKRDNVKDKDGNEIYEPYYSTEAYKGNPDPLGVIEPISLSNGQDGGDISQQCISKIEVKDPIYDFENPTIRKEWLLPDDMINYYKEDNYKNLKMVFNIILNYLKINNKVQAEQFEKELELYSNINANKGISTEQVIINIEQVLNKLLEKTDSANKLKRLRANEKNKSTNTDANKQSIKDFTNKINEILLENKMSPIRQLEFKDAAFRGQQLGPFKMAYKPDINEIIQNIREQYKSVELLTTIFKSYNLSQEDFNKIKVNIFTPHGNYDNLLELVKDLELETNCREENSNVICENRREEGYFINNSLEKVREVIKKILFEKNKQSINITPDFIDICFKNYCPHHSNCFSFDNFSNQNSSSDTTGSVIFDEIFKELQQIKQYQKPEDMYKDIIISIFCVFNISRGANNPPPTPYLDINKLKVLFYYEDILENTNNEEFISEFEKIINMISIEFKDKVSDLKTIKSNISKQKTIYNLFEEVGQYFKKNKNNIDASNYNRLYKYYVKEFIDMIDKSNAVAAIGTLEFLDQIAKFNTVKTICNPRDTNFIQQPTLDEFNKNNIMTPLYDNNYAKGGSKKYTKKNQFKNKRNTKKK